LNKIVLITSDLSSGGAQRVIATLSNNFSSHKNYQIHLVCLIQGEVFYYINSTVNLHFPNFNYKNYPRFISYLRTLLYLRRKLKEIEPISYLSFGGRYNALCIIAGLGLKSKSFISDRSQPGISYGKFLDVVNRIFYPYAYGIVAQTLRAKYVHLSRFSHSNIKVIGNPIPDFYDSRVEERNVILNVGRFVESKNQNFLIELFDELNPDNWELWLVGDGPLLDVCKKQAMSLKSADRIKFMGKNKDVRTIYNSARIFAFTSTSEGFPNALGEAMSAGLACISFNCNAGPSDLIEDGVDGFLVNELNREVFKEYLELLLMENSNLKLKFKIEAQNKIKSYYNEDFIAKEYLTFLNDAKGFI
jgi:GalNAc-alpha-(1->4)-GalNAc-alpha-(1->3)-diNAcBac-PP-undecaprenol alpha-1,4-N-acetyl-D-galactosaminyltransferase